MKNLAIHAVIVLLALVCFADAFRLQSKVKATTETKQEEDWDWEACSDCTGQCASFIWPEPTPDAHRRCVNDVMYEDCCDTFCSNVCPPDYCYYGIFNQCSMYGWFPL
jgi:hypothetical protein